MMTSVQGSYQEFASVFERHKDDYPTLKRAGRILKEPTDVVGRSYRRVADILKNRDKGNLSLTAEAGTGKSTYVTGFVYSEEAKRNSMFGIWIDWIRLMENPNGDKSAEIQRGLLNLFDEVEAYARRFNVIPVIIIDEFHKIMMTNEDCAEDLKPILEKSSKYGFRVIAISTSSEWNKWVAGNLPLDQRFQRLNLEELTRDNTIMALMNQVAYYGLTDVTSPRIYGEIYDISKQYLPMNAQPRASLDILSSMIGIVTDYLYFENGEEKAKYYSPEEMGYPSDYLLNHYVLAQVIESRFNIDIDHKVNIRKLEKDIKTRVYGQDYAIEQFLGLVQRARMGFNDKTRPLASVIFTGPTGSGKTQLTKEVSAGLGVKLSRFDMTLYSDPSTALAFVIDLVKAAWSHPNGIILLDEIEKSCKEVINTLFAVLDDARLADGTNSERVISFAGNIIVLTTNVGSKLYQSISKTGAAVEMSAIYSAFEGENFNVALLGRVDKVIPFMPLTIKVNERIVNYTLRERLETSVTKQRDYLVDPTVIGHIIRDKTPSDSERGGARNMKRILSDYVLEPLSFFIDRQDPKTGYFHEFPVVIGIKGHVRHKYQDQGDINSGTIVLKECHSFATVDAVLAKLGELHGVTFKADKLFMPIDDYASAQDLLIAFNKAYTTHGVTHFKTVAYFNQANEETEVLLANGDDTTI